MSRIQKTILSICLAISLLNLSGCASLLKPKLKQDLIEIQQGEYLLDKSHSTVLFKIDHMGFSKFVGRFNSFESNLSFDPDNIENSTLEAVVDMRTVDVNNEKFERALKGRFWFDSENYPQAHFKTLSAKKINEQNIVFQGELTFLGQTKLIDVTVHVNGAANNLLTGKYTLGFSAEARFLRSDFGLDRYIPSVGDEVELEIHAEFQRK